MNSINLFSQIYKKYPISFVFQNNILYLYRKTKHNENFIT